VNIATDCKADKLSADLGAYNGYRDGAGSFVPRRSRHPVNLHRSSFPSGFGVTTVTRSQPQHLKQLLKALPVTFWCHNLRAAA
jgi:hypothetical protein